MGYNQLSGTIAAASGSEIISTYFSGAYSGDGASLEAVNHTTQTNTAEHRIPFFDSTTAVGPLGNQYNIRGTSSFTYDKNTEVLTLNGTGSFSAITLNSASSEAGVLTKYLALNASNQIVLTSSYGDGNSGAAVGPTGSLQFHSSNSEFSGSENLIYDVGSTTLTLTGTLTISGTINANELNIDVTNKNVINLDVSGSTKFGDTLDDVHQFTGSMFISGTLVRNRVPVTTTTYEMSGTDYYVAIQTDLISDLSTITLPVASTLQSGQSFVIKDEGGSAATYNIKLTASAADLIDGTSFVMIESPYGALNLYTNGTDKYFIY